MNTIVTEQKECGTGDALCRAPRVRTYSPRVDIFETDDHLIIRADMPGVSSKNVEVEFVNGVLTVEGKAEARHEPDTMYLHREYGVGNFSRCFEILEDIDADAITAKVAQGVLEITLPKTEAAKPHRISVTGG
ncbi:MAG: Hsp20/alpha crystallin family protein [Planctomycetota bacterium]|jgi:HSP20 family protein